MKRILARNGHSSLEAYRVASRGPKAATYDEAVRVDYECAFVGGAIE